MNTHGSAARAPHFALTLGALGVVFGDIGTSPLYAFKAVFAGEGERPGLQLTPDHVYGVLSLMMWSVTLVVSIKYILLMLQADNDGEGGELSLSALIRSCLARLLRQEGTLPPTTEALALHHAQGHDTVNLSKEHSTQQVHRYRLLFSAAGILGIIAAGLFYGDSMITPAISILSAVEGLGVATPQVDEFIVPICAVIVAVLFSIQRWGTGAVGKAFGPVMVLWFVTLGVLGVISIVTHPGIVSALSPHHAALFIIREPFVAFLALGAVVLTVTGAEALYADMGHFGRTPISRGWFFLVFPCLALNYLGQGAYALEHNDASHPFFAIVPEPLQLPMVVLATLATVIASQAVISGAFSVSMQAQRLGYLPRLSHRYTSDHRGHIYVPAINLLLCAGALILIFGFQSSERLSSAYGIAVSGSFILSTSLLLMYLRIVRRWSWPAVVVVGTVFGIFELMLFSANALKVFTGGWIPLLIASLCILIMMTWRSGIRLTAMRRAEVGGSWKRFEERTEIAKLPRVPGTAVYMHQNLATIPLAMVTNIRMNRALHERIVIVEVKVNSVPRVPKEKRLNVTRVHHGIDVTLVRVNYGFKDNPDIPRALRSLGCKNPWFITARVALAPAACSRMAMWQKHLFIWMFRNQARAASQFHLPVQRAVGIETELRI